MVYTYWNVVISSAIWLVYQRAWGFWKCLVEFWDFWDFPAPGRLPKACHTSGDQSCKTLHSTRGAEGGDRPMKQFNNNSMVCVPNVKHGEHCLESLLLKSCFPTYYYVFVHVFFKCIVNLPLGNFNICLNSWCLNRDAALALISCFRLVSMCSIHVCPRHYVLCKTLHCDTRSQFVPGYVVKVEDQS